ncbi:NLP/P60 protein [Actinobacteria bacterium OK074]|nr:NLP/P60 protein [Actinobacteria bacterium OK074]
MAAHRKPRPNPLSGPTARTAVTVAIAGVATATVLDGTGQAAPRLSPEQVRAKVDTLYREAEVATERYDGAKEQAEKADRRLGTLRDEAARRTEHLNSARDTLGSYAAAQYRTGGIDPAVQLMLSSRPQEYLDGAAFAERAGSRQTAAVRQVRQQLREIEQLRGAARVQVASLKSRQAELRREKRTITGKLNEAKQLLSQLTAPQREQVTAATAAGVAGSAGLAGRVSRSGANSARDGLAPASATTTTAPNSRAAAAVSYAYRKLGSPYVWGATGPDAFDCSGLVQAAYHSAGVSLPRTTYAQINAGQRVSRAELRPGDLVFFYSGISHVGIYVGNGQMIHAPNPTAPVRLAPIAEMPFAGATRVV